MTPEETAEMRERIELYAKVVRDEDYSSSFSIQDGINSGANKDFLFGRNEGGAQKFHQSVQHYVEEYRKIRQKA